MIVYRNQIDDDIFAQHVERPYKDLDGAEQTKHQILLLMWILGYDI